MVCWNQNLKLCYWIGVLLPKLSLVSDGNVGLSAAKLLNFSDWTSWLWRCGDTECSSFLCWLGGVKWSMLYAASTYMKSWFLFVLGFINSPKDLFYIIVALFRNELLTDNTLCCSHVLICGLSHAKNLGVWELRQLFCGRTWKFKLRFVPFLQGSLLNLASTYVKLLVFVSAQYHLIVLLSWGCPLCLLKWIVRYWCLVVLTSLVCGLSDAMILGVWLMCFFKKKC